MIPTPAEALLWISRFPELSLLSKATIIVAIEARLEQQGVSTKGTITGLAAGTLTLNNVKQRRLLASPN